MRALLRPWLWGCGAAIALAAAIVIVICSDAGSQRITTALANIYAPATPAFAASDTRQLSGSAQVLAAERSRLLGRIASLERNLGEATGSVKIASAPAQLAERPATPDEPAGAPIRFGIDLGSATNMEAMRAQWAVAKANHSELLEGLRPLVGVRESKPGTPELRLIVGPLPNIAVASKLCAALAALHTYCRTAVFDGQRLARDEPAKERGPAKTMAAACPDKPDALGTSRVLKVSAGELGRLGTMQYQQSLPLADREVVLTFDDGPLPPYTDRVLAALAAECVKATYFLVGRQANANPDTVRKIYNAGHSIGTHSQHHSYTIASMSPENVAREINSGFVSVGNALGDQTAVAPFFRFPGLMRTNAGERYLASQSIMAWSADLDADDWRGIGPEEVMRRVLSRLEARGKGVVLLHDIQPSTVLMLPTLLKELKKRGYRIVHVVPDIAGPKSLPMAGDGKPAKQAWPRVSAIPAGALN